MSLFRRSFQGKGYVFPIRPILPLDQYFPDDYLDKIHHSLSVRSSPQLADERINHLKSLHPTIRQILQLRPKKQDLATMVEVIEDNQGDRKAYFTNVRPDQSYLLSELEKIEKELSSLEDQVIPFLLSLPNEVDEDLPTDQPFIVIDELTKQRPKFKLLDWVKLSYINFGQHTSIIGPASRFITGEGAKLYIALARYFSSTLLKANFIPFVGLDMVKSSIMEACDVDDGERVPFDPLLVTQGDDAETLNNFLHLTGESSFQAIASMINRREINLSLLPIKFSSIGSTYSTSLSQRHTVNCVILTSPNPRVSAQETQSMVTFAYQLYKDLDIPCRLVKFSGRLLKANESSRFEIQVWMPTSSTWKTCAFVSNHRDFTTKRLGREGFSMIRGNLVDCETIVASIMENNQQEDGTFVIPDLLQQQLIPKSM